VTATAERVEKTRKLTLAAAADQWENADAELEELQREVKRLEGLKKQAAPVVLDHLVKTGRTRYKGRIELVQGSPRRVLDQTRVKEFLGDRIADYETTVTPAPKLKRLKT
jgi:hypothetical protein